MPHRRGPQRTVVTFLTDVRHPSLIRKAAKKVGKPSNTVYIQHAICEALSRDLNMPIEDLLATLPPNRATDPSLFGGSRRMPSFSD